MDRAVRRYLLLSVVVLAALAAQPAAQQRRLITETDLFRFVWIADPQIAPDGAQVAFVRVTADEKKDQYDTSIWIVPADGSAAPRPLTGGTRDVSPRWSPDGRRLAFVRAAEKDGRVQPPQIYMLSLAGGEGRAITDIPRAPVRRPGRPTVRPSPLPRARVPPTSRPGLPRRRIPRRRARATSR